MIKILLGLVFVIGRALPLSDRVSNAPGMIGAVIYSGYLNTANAGRTIHYVYAQAESEPEAKPLVLWLNGGPGCSSLIGFLQELGPYKIPNKYQPGDILPKNPYSWTKVANMLFFQSPAIVGFSSESDGSYVYTDKQTADDATAALQDFIFNKAPQFKTRDLYLSGQSYAGKYIPDIATRIIDWNRNPANPYVQLKGLFIDVYEVCTPTNNEQAARLQKIKSIVDTINENIKLSSIQLKYSNKTNENIISETFPECPSDNGAISYWNFNGVKNAFHVTGVNKDWSPCSNLIYEITQEGSMTQYQKIFLNRAIRVWLYSGDFDDVVPFIDTYRNLNKLGRGFFGVNLKPWFTNKQHSGMYWNNDQITLITVKAAGHMVPQNKPAAALDLFTRFLSGKPMGP